MYALGKKGMDTDTFMSLNRRLWDQLDRNIWPQELVAIKPNKWETMDANLKGKAVLENLGKIIYHVTLLGHESEQVKKQQPLTPRDQPDLAPTLAKDGAMDSSPIYR